MNTIDTSPYGALLLRLALGVMYIAHGLLKIFVFTLPGTVSFFENFGYPGWMAYAVVAAEIGGGALLIVGLYVRPVALALAPVLMGALISVHWANGWLFSAKGGGWEYPAFLVAASVVQALIGGGAFAISLPFSGKDHGETA